MPYLGRIYLLFLLGRIYLLRPYLGKNPNSLLGQTLLNKYCRTENILECSAPNSASHGWRGILAGCDLLKQELGWVIGDGHSVSVWSDNWMSTTQQLCPMGPPTAESQNMKVQELFIPNSTTWDVDKLKTYLPQYEVIIRKIVPSSQNMKDEIVWLLEKSGNY